MCLTERKTIECRELIPSVDAIAQVAVTGGIAVICKEKASKVQLREVMQLPGVAALSESSAAAG